MVTTSNHNGGLLGGITNGMPLIARLTVKPTSSISQPPADSGPGDGPSRYPAGQRAVTTPVSCRGRCRWRRLCWPTVCWTGWYPKGGWTGEPCRFTTEGAAGWTWRISPQSIRILTKSIRSWCGFSVSRWTVPAGWRNQAPSGTAHSQPGAGGRHSGWTRWRPWPDWDTEGDGYDDVVRLIYGVTMDASRAIQHRRPAAGEGCAAIWRRPTGSCRLRRLPGWCARAVPAPMRDEAAGRLFPGCRPQFWRASPMYSVGAGGPGRFRHRTGGEPLPVRSTRYTIW